MDLNGYQMPKLPWIWLASWQFQDNEEPAFVAFRREFILAEAPQEAQIKISADSRYKLYVNGQFVHCGPRKGDMKVWYYDVLDLAGYLKAEANVLAVEVLRYPQNHRKGNHGIFRTEIPGLYLEGTVIDIQGNSIDLTVDEKWKARRFKNRSIYSENPFFAPLQILENASGDAALARWMLPGYDEQAWEAAQPYNIFQIAKAISPGNLLPRSIPLMKNEDENFVGISCLRQSVYVTAEWEAMLKGQAVIEIPANSHEIIEIDAGELTTGYLKLALTGGTGSEVRILTSECYAYEPENTSFMAMPRKGDRTDSVHGRLYGFTDTYRPGGFGSKAQPEVYEPYWFRTFRFIQLDIETGAEPLFIEQFDYIETGYPLNAQTTVETSDPEMAAIWDISLRTLRRCMHETYEDCPFYEQLQYAMDTRSQILYTYMVSADDRLARQCIDDFHRSVRYDGMINCCYPSYGPNIIPGFSIYYILMIYDHMMYFGDESLVRRYMPTVEGILNFFKREVDERGLVGKVGGLNMRDAYWSFIDWTKEWNETTGVPRATLEGPITMESFLYAYGLMHGAKLMRFIGRNEAAAEYEAQADKVLKAIDTWCLGENGLYQDGPGVKEYSQHCQVFAVLTGAATGDRAKEILLEVLPEEAPYAKCSVAMAFYLFRAVEEAGLYESSERLWEPWRKMLKDHLTTSVEDGVNSRSDCHAWGALALFELPAVTLGIRPAAPGFSKVVMKPQPGYFQWASGKVITPKGVIEAAWKKTADGKLETEYKLPEGIEVLD